MLKKISIITGFLIVAFLASGYFYQKWSSDKGLQAYPRPGQIYEINSHLMHLHCLGKGQPTIILEAGIHQASFGWDLVHEKISQVTRVCTYDRPGLGYSEPVSHLILVDEVVSNLNQLLRAAGIDGPTVIVGMSGGGVYVRRYRELYPDKIVGMVLIDSSHEQQEQRLPPYTSYDPENLIYKICRVLAPFGIVRVSGLIDGMLDDYHLSGELLQKFSASYKQTHSCGVLLRENLAFDTDLQNQDTPAGLGSLPLVVVSRDMHRITKDTYGMAPDQYRHNEEVWQLLQKELAVLSSNSKHIIAKRSGHVIQFDRPDVVIEAILDIVKYIRANMPENMASG